MVKKIGCIVFVLILLAGCNKKPEERTIFAMDTVMSISAYTNQQVIQMAVDKIYELESYFNANSEDSILACLNRDKKINANNDVLQLIAFSKEIAQKTQGAFDPTIYPLVKEWGFISKDYKIPDEDKINTLLKYVDYNSIAIENNEISLANENTELDLGAVAKGYTSQQVVDLLREQGVTSGIISLGGNVYALGTKPDGEKWKVGIQNPDNDDYAGVIQVADKAVITSGGYQRFFRENGVTYHHILDTATGYPANSGLKSVTIVSHDGALADGLSTAVYVMGYDKAVKLWKNSDNFDMILIDDENKIYVTKNIADDFIMENGTFSIIE